jgi:hypothetical protein
MLSGNLKMLEYSSLLECRKIPVGSLIPGAHCASYCYSFLNSSLASTADVKKLSTVTLLQEPNRVFKCNSEVCSCNHCCHEIPISITYSECVSVAVVIQKAK